MRYTWLLAILLLLAQPSWGFVEKLHPNHMTNGGGGISCNAIAAALFNYAKPGGPPAAILSSIIQREWVPEGWSAQDIADNQALIALMDAATQAGKYIMVEEVKYGCYMWEMDVDELNSPAEFRLRIGLPPAP